MAKYLPRLFVLYFQLGIVRSYAYEFADEKPDPELRDKEQHFGLLRRDGSPKPAFTALKHLLALLRDPGPAFTPGALEFTLAGDTRDLRHLLLQKRDGRFFLLLWQEVASYDVKTKQDLAVPEATVTLTLAQPRQQARVFRPGRSAEPQSSHTHTRELRLTVPDELLVIEVTPTK